MLDHMTTTQFPVFEKLASHTLRGRIAEKIRTAILNGSLREGQRLVERSLASQFGASLTAVREALIELETEGFVVKKPNAATYVTRMSPEGAQKIFLVRKLLEGFAVEEAARLATPEQIEVLEKRYMEVLDAARAVDRHLFAQKDFLLHEAIWQITNNEYLQAALRRCVLPIFAFSAIRFASGGPFDFLQDAYSHLPVLEAIKARDQEAARKAFLAACEEWRSKIFAFLFRQTGGETEQPVESAAR